MRLLVVHPTIDFDSSIIVELVTKHNITQLSFIFVQGELLPLFWCSCLPINVSVQYSGVFLPEL